MRALLVAISFLFLSSSWAQLNPQPKKLTEKFFQDLDITIPTPAFQKRRGFTEYEDMMPFLEELAKQHPQLMRIVYIGQSQKGEKIPMVRLGRLNATSPKLRIWMQGGLHGNEPASIEGMLYLMHKLLNNKDYNYLLDSIEIAIVPMANIDGANKVNRYAANGLDLNRDQTKLAAQESVALKKAFNNFKPHVAVDFHEYRPFRRDYAKLSTFGVTVPYDVMFLYSGNLNVPQPLRNFTQQNFVNKAKAVLDENQLSHHDYFSSTKVDGSIQFNQGSINARSSATSYALANTVSSLIEIRGVGIGRTSFTRRVYSTFLVAETYLKEAHQNASAVRAILKEAAGQKGLAMVSSTRQVLEAPVPMIDIETNAMIELNGVVRNAWYSSPKISRQRPTAYLLSAQQKQVVEKLRILGVVVDSLPKAKTLEVEAYQVTSYYQEAQKYEGTYRQEVTAELKIIEKQFAAGTYVVRLNQEKANMAIEVLEPEAPNSFVSFDVLHTEKDAVLPIYRYLKINGL